MAPPNTIFPPLGEVSPIFPRFPVPASSSSFFVPEIPLLPNSTQLTTYAGSLPARPGAADNAYLYFLLLRARHSNGSKRKLIIWFNGGPGCSSFDGSMMEIGAWKSDGKGGLKWAPLGGAWNEYADVLFLDQPVGTGFSYVNTNAYASSIPQAADEVLYFLKRFVEVFPEFAKGNGADVYLAGESFAGQYIPYTAEAIRKAGRSSPVDLVGLAIGNGFIDPKSQYGSEVDMLVKAGVWQTNSKEYKEAKAISDDCQRILKNTKGNPRYIGRCESILTHIQELSKTKVEGKDMCINIYDVRLSDDYPACGMHWPTTLKATYDYLKRPEVRKAFHVDENSKPEAWVECNNRVHTALTDGSTTQASVELLPALLKSGIEVMLFAGDQDLICNHVGVERLVENLSWEGQKGFSTSSTEQEWFVNNTLAGAWRSERGLTYVRVAGASHMVGVDVPVQSHDMMLRFMKVDLLGVAGPNGRIPSRVGEGADRQLLIGGGGAVDDRPMIPGVDGKSEEQVAEEAKWAAYYNAGSAALVFLLLAVSIGVFIILRLRRKARLANQGVRLGGGLMGRSNGMNDESHELEHLVEEPEEEEEDEDQDRNQGGRWSDGTARQGHRDSNIRENEEIFDVGNESDESEGKR